VPPAVEFDDQAVVAAADAIRDAATDRLPADEFGAAEAVGRRAIFP
jgi:hypothetical protein